MLGKKATLASVEGMAPLVSLNPLMPITRVKTHFSTSAEW